jgi:hypothetical protein
MRTAVNMGGKLAVAFALTMALASPAMATGSNICRWFPRLCGVTVPRTPEIDPSLARGTLTILLGGAERRRRRR